MGGAMIIKRHLLRKEKCMAINVLFDITKTKLLLC